MGAYNISNGDGGGYTVDNMLFEKLILHPNYTGFHGKEISRISLQHDVMLVKLYGESDQPVVTLHNPKLVNEFAHREPGLEDELVVVGWGDTDPASGEEGTNLASALHAAKVNYVPNDVCKESKGYSSIESIASTKEGYFEYDGSISDDMMCAIGSEDAIGDACQGDSGGGLIRLSSSDSPFDGRGTLHLHFVEEYSAPICSHTAYLHFVKHVDRCPDGHSKLGITVW